ncbi:basic amino acid ABC transporter substrate-binding protein [Halorussus limi]|uniref:Basic amino acid ABC transporter substrate-binding protein n=1 Tax=Halorussus limi TaxID=2938695 RepID=A0A8U0HVY8_9EURY|nr:basic amino acid ABC transporter substrate-binding protein [Halorussus limi]UPV74784.1 basic amino acid ABC transporter substrate-binding protein [Halorussus limi]
MDIDRRSFVKGSAGIVGGLSLGGFAGAQDEGVVRIGSDIPYKPFEYRTQSGELTGFDVELADAIFQELGREYEFVQTGFDTIIPSLNNGNFRIIMSAMTINDQRDQQVDFSEPYFIAYQTVAILKGSDVQSVEDLEGKTVAVQKGTTGEAAAQQLKKRLNGNLNIDSYDQIPGAFNALLNNQAAAVINDNAVNLQYADERDSIVMLEGEGQAAQEFESAPPYLTLTVERYGIAFRQDDDEFRRQVNEALNAVIGSGRYAEIYKEYFTGEPPQAILSRARPAPGTTAANGTAGNGTTAANGTAGNATETTTNGG